jgi:hypothetical protein
MFLHFPCKIATKKGADERTRTADLESLYECAARHLGATEQPIAELRPPLPNASTEATLKGGLIVAPTHRCSKTRMAPPLFM